MGEKPTKKKMATWKKVIIGVVVAIIVIIAAGMGYVYSTLNKTNKVKLDNDSLGLNHNTHCIIWS